jgi:biopolymer transport protein ExbB/TolQ
MTNRPPNSFNAHRSDPEALFGVRPGWGTSVSLWFSGILASLLSALFIAGMYWLPNSQFRSLFLDRGPTQYATVLLGFWCVVILILKWRKLKIQRLPLRVSILPSESDFVLSSQTADTVSHRIHTLADEPERFLIFHRILTAISNLKNLGRVSDVDDIIRSLGEQDESSMETSFSILNGFLWAIPVLGFIGTVLGLSSSIARFSTLLEQQAEVAGIISSLKEVTAGLSTAFETTLLSLVVALFVQLWLTTQKKAEEEFLDECSKYCLKNITNRIKILPFEQSREI